MKYPLLPYSQLVWEMTRWNPWVYVFPFIICWKNGAEQKAQVEQAFRTVLNNHPVFSMRVDWKGRQYAIESKDILHGQYHDVTIYIKGNDLYVRLSGGRILGDGESGAILARDLCRAYNGLSLGEDDYWGYVAQYERNKNESHYCLSKEWCEREFADESVPVHPTIDRRRLMTLIAPKVGVLEDEYTALSAKIEQLQVEHFISHEGIFSLCAALAIAEYCGSHEAALTWAYEGREKEDEQHIFGSLHRDIPFYVPKSIIENRESAIRLARKQIRSGIAHSDYPYTLTAPYNKRWNYAVNVLRVPEIDDVISLLPFPVQLVSAPEQKGILSRQREPDRQRVSEYNFLQIFLRA